MVCPNCRGDSYLSLGVCDSQECLSGPEKILFCDNCYDEHVINNHSNFKELTEEELVEKYGIKTINYRMHAKCGAVIDVYAPKNGFIENWDKTCHDEKCGGKYHKIIKGETI